MYETRSQEQSVTLKLNNKSFYKFWLSKQLAGIWTVSWLPQQYFSIFFFFFLNKMAFVNSTLSVQFRSPSCFVWNKIAPPNNLKSVRMMLETWDFVWKERKPFTSKKNQYWGQILTNLLMQTFFCYNDDSH